MSLKDQLQADLKAAMFSKDERRKNVIRLTLAEFKNTEVAKRQKLIKERSHLWAKPGEVDADGNPAIDAEKRGKELAEIDQLTPLTEAEMQAVLATEVKRRRDTIAELETANRPDLLEEAKAQLELALPYLPAQMGREDVITAAQKVIAEVGASGPQAAGEVMKRLMPGLKGKADGKLINEVVRDLLK
jgi:uncharacterized protein